MSINFTIHTAKSLIVTTAVGEVCYADVTRYLDDLMSAPEYRPVYNEIFDLSAASIQISSEEIRALSRLSVPTLPAGQTSKVALVASGDLEFALARMFQLNTLEDATQEVCVFRNRRDAEAWIDVTPD